MRKRCLIEPCLALLFAVAVPASLHAQARNGEGNPSHIEVPFHPPADGQFADFLKSRDHAAQAREIYQKLQNLFKEPDVLRKNRDTLKELLDQDEQPRRLEDLDKDELRALLERLRDRLQRAQKREVDQVDDLDKALLPLLPNLDAFGDVEFFKKYLDRMPTGERINPPLDPPKPDTKKPSDPNTPSAPPQKSTVPEQPVERTPQPEPSREEQHEALQKNLASWWDHVKDSPLGKSETLRDLGRKFSRPFLRPSDPDGEHWLEGLPRLAQYIPFKDLFPQGLPSVPKPDWSRAVPSGSTPSVGSFEAPSGSSMISVLWVGLVVLTIVLLWKLLASPRAQATAAQPVWQLGPWPVNPAEVATRQDLIRAFEHLSLLVFGQAARAWNHRDIAARLRDQPGAPLERGSAADHLADLYERARYAPSADPLPDSELHDARRDLCLLAGVASA